MTKKINTLLCNDEGHYKSNQGAIVPPIYQNSLFSFESWDDIDQAFSSPSDHYIYSRLHNPTSRIAEEKIAALADAEDAKLTASGMGAISAAILHYVNHGDHIITIKDIYGPANGFINGFLKEKCNISASFVDGTVVENFEKAIQKNTKLIYLESPASITMSLQDLEGVVAIAKKYNIATVIDNTWSSPIYQRCIEIGIDMEVHSASKYLCGHSDVVAGVIIGRKKDLQEILIKEHALLGAKMSPFESWLILRSLRTLTLRMQAHQLAGIEVARFLQDHPMVRKVMYPGLESFPQYDLAHKQMKGFGSLLSFELATDKLDKIKAFVDGLRLFHLGVSWGGHESLVYAPVISYAKELSPEQFKKMGIIPGLIRISIGLESVEDLIKDLDKNLNLIEFLG